jgi:sugar O-acyltransferase (sialic acid O-acetyltransferase NeuD family)
VRGSIRMILRLWSLLQELIKNMKDIAIYGAGGFGREVACLLNAINANDAIWNLIGFFDDVKEVGYTNEYGKVLGGIDGLNSYPSALCVVFAIGSPHGVANLMDRISNQNIDFPNIIAPNVRFADDDNLKLGVGNIFSWDCHISCNVRIGNFNIFNGYITVGHDAIIGDFNSFMPGVRISGETNIGNKNYFGVSSVLLQKKRVGYNTVIGAGSVIIRPTKNNSTYMGNPATIVKY